MGADFYKDLSDLMFNTLHFTLLDMKWFVLSMIILIVVVCMAEMILHLFPWRLVLLGNELPRTIAYMLGVLGFAIPLSIWLAVWNYSLIVLVLWMCVVAAGGTVLSLYLFDYAVKKVWELIEKIQRLELYAKK